MDYAIVLQIPQKRFVDIGGPLPLTFPYFCSMGTGKKVYQYMSQVHEYLNNTKAISLLKTSSNSQNLFQKQFSVP